ncbi:MAG: 4Fe-4S dicluster domain-containing protein [Cellulosilyticaceae bacterium]
MSHIVGKEAYKTLEERLNQFPQGAPPSDTLYKILETLFSEREAILVAQLPIRPFSIKTAARIWHMSESEAFKVLNELASRAILLDMEHDNQHTYILPPPMAGFFEFSMMRTKGNVNAPLLGELYYQYMNEEEDFIKDLFYSTETKLGRVFVQEEVLTNDNEVQILDFERTSHIIKTSSDMGISTCYCRHKMHHVGKSCNAPMDICMTFGSTASSLIKHGHARRVDAVEGMELLHQAYESNLVQCGENVRSGVTFICNCCGCCCEALVAAREFGMMHPVQTTAFLPVIDEQTCVNCGKCAKACPVFAISQAEATHKVTINHDLCLGCGVCVRNCPKKCMHLTRREEQIITPANSVHRVVLMAIEKGQLANLIFDKQALKSHRMMAAILSTILKMPPVYKALASKQLKSVYLDRLLRNS